MDRSLRVRAALEAKGPLQVLRSGLQEHGLVTSAENTLLATHIIGALSEMPPCRGRSLQPESLSPTLNSLASCDSCCRMERDKSRQPALGRRYQRQSVFLEILAGHGIRVRGAGVSMSRFRCVLNPTPLPTPPQNRTGTRTRHRTWHSAPSQRESHAASLLFRHMHSAIGNPTDPKCGSHKYAI